MKKLWYSLGKEFPEMVWLPEPKHISAVLKSIGRNYKAVLEPQGRDTLHSLKEQIRDRRLYLKHETIESG